MKSLNKEVKFEVGDKVVYVHDGTVWEVIRKQLKGIRILISSETVVN